MYQIRIAPQARKDIKRLDKRTQSRIVKVLESLKEVPRPTGKVEKLKDQPKYWRYRVGDFRIVYHVRDDYQVVIVLLVKDRKEAYRHLPKVDASVIAKFLTEIRNKGVSP